MTTDEFLEQIHTELREKDDVIAALRQSLDAQERTVTAHVATIAAKDATITALREQIVVLVQQVAVEGGIRGLRGAAA
jgi:hypothetical protein